LALDELGLHDCGIDLAMSAAVENAPNLTVSLADARLPRGT